MRSPWFTIPAILATGFVSFACGAGALSLELSLPIQDVNILVLTDVHSWVAGHTHEPGLDADYGHVLSFYEKLREACNLQEKDLFFVMNGDFIDGTGLSTYPPVHLTPILEQMPWDALNIGNHELYKNSTVHYITRENGFVDHWDGGYLTSNTLLIETNETRPIGERYKFMTGAFDLNEGRNGTVQKNSTILTFGFLYNFLGHCEMTIVEKVEEVVESEWFQDVLNGKDREFDAIVVLAHMGANDPLTDIILDKIRDICGAEMPVQFITGHTHKRMNVTLDAYSESFEAGKFLDTVGFVSFSLNNSASALASNANFRHEFIDANIKVMKNVLGVPDTDTFVTPNGRELTEMIKVSQEATGLFVEMGCSPKTYYLSNGLDKEDSLWGFYADTVIREQLFSERVRGFSTQKLFIQNPGGFRYNLFQGIVNVNDLVSMSPYNDTIYKIGTGIKGSEFIETFGDPNVVSAKDHNSFHSELPSMIVSGIVEKNKLYEVYSVDFDQEYVATQLQNTTGRFFFPTPMDGITTNTLWNDYMEENWSCNPKEDTGWDAILEFFEEFTVMKIIAFLLSFMVVLFFGWMFLCRNVQPTRKFGTIDAADDDLSYFDESGMGEFSEEEDVFPIGSPPQQSLRGNSYQSIYQQKLAESEPTFV
jgi:2',3'-cyclic-nucleotide 2'-phosphodiesterase (5'-nucleotidase family)